jgi:hypothetical protein
MEDFRSTEDITLAIPHPRDGKENSSEIPCSQITPANGEFQQVPLLKRLLLQAKGWHHHCTRTRQTPPIHRLSGDPLRSSKECSMHSTIHSHSRQLLYGFSQQARAALVLGMCEVSRFTRHSLLLPGFENGFFTMQQARARRRHSSPQTGLKATSADTGRRLYHR